MEEYQASSSASLNNMLLANTIGMSIIKDAFQCAAHYLTKGNNGYNMSSIYSTREGSASLAYIQGTGLEMTIQRFCLNLDADSLRTSFFHMIKTNGL